MSKLADEQIRLLGCAGFTLKQISMYQLKFWNLFNTYPMHLPNHLKAQVKSVPNAATVEAMLEARELSKIKQHISHTPEALFAKLDRPTK